MLAMKIISIALALWNRMLALSLEWLLTSPQNLSIFPSGYAIASNLNIALQSIGTSLLVIFTLYGLVNSGIRYSEMKRPEFFVKTIVLFIVAEYFVLHGMEVLGMIYKIVNAVAIKSLKVGTSSSSVQGIFMSTQVQDSFQGLYSADYDFSGISSSIVSVFNIIRTLLGGEFLGHLETVIVSAIISVIMIVTCGQIVIQILVRAIRNYVYIAISPIALSTLACEPTKQHGIKYIKSYIGYCFEAVFITISTVIFLVFSGYISSNIQNMGIDILNLAISWQFMELVAMITYKTLVIKGSEMIHELLAL